MGHFSQTHGYENPQYSNIGTRKHEHKLNARTDNTLSTLFCVYRVTVHGAMERILQAGSRECRGHNS